MSPRKADGKGRERERSQQDLLPTDMRLGHRPLPVLRFRETAQWFPVAGCP